MECRSGSRHFLRVDSSANLERCCCEATGGSDWGLGQLSVGYAMNAVRHKEENRSGGGGGGGGGANADSRSTRSSQVSISISLSWNRAKYLSQWGGRDIQVDIIAVHCVRVALPVEGGAAGLVRRRSRLVPPLPVRVVRAVDEESLGRRDAARPLDRDGEVDPRVVGRLHGDGAFQVDRANCANDTC